MKVETKLNTSYITQLKGFCVEKVNLGQTGADPNLIFPKATALPRTGGQMPFLGAEAEIVAKMTEIKDIIGAHLEAFAFQENRSMSRPNETMN